MHGCTSKVTSKYFDTKHIYFKLEIFDISAFSIHVNNTDVTKAAWYWSLILAPSLWSGSKSKKCIFQGGYQAARWNDPGSIRQTAD